MSELEQPNKGTVLNNSTQTHQSGNWLEGYIAVLVGLLLVSAVFLLFALPAMAITLLGQALLDEAGIWLAAVIIAPAWIWLCFRFFLPTTMQIIWIDGKPALFALNRATMGRMIGVVTAQLSVLQSDLRSFSARIRNRLNA